MKKIMVLDSKIDNVRRIERRNNGAEGSGERKKKGCWLIGSI